MQWMALGLALITAVAMQPPSARATVLGFAASLAPRLTARQAAEFRRHNRHVADTLQINIDWTGLSGTTTVAHIHCCTTTPFTGTARVAVTPMSFPGFPGFNGTLPGFPSVLPVLPAYCGQLRQSGYHPLACQFRQRLSPICSAGSRSRRAEAKLIANLSAGKAYVNVHSSEFPSGEIRGFPHHCGPGAFQPLAPRWAHSSGSFLWSAAAIPPIGHKGQRLAAESGRDLQRRAGTRPCWPSSQEGLARESRCHSGPAALRHFRNVALLGKGCGAQAISSPISPNSSATMRVLGEASGCPRRVF